MSDSAARKEGHWGSRAMKEANYDDRAKHGSRDTVIRRHAKSQGAAEADEVQAILLVIAFSVAGVFVTVMSDVVVE